MSSRDRSLLTALVPIIIAVIGYFIVVTPEHHRASQLQAQITTSEGTLSQAEAEVAAGSEAESQYEAYAKQLKDMRAAVPSDEQIPALITELQTASDKNRVAFQSVSVSSSSSSSTSTSATTGISSTFPSQSFSLSFTGNYFSVADLLGTVAAFVHADNTHFSATGRLITIGSVSLSPKSAAKGDVTAAVTAIDYDVPTSPLSSTTGTSNGTSANTSTGEPAADVSP